MIALVTGAAGFIGSALAGELLARGIEVHGLVRAGTDLGRLGKLRSQIVIHQDELQDAAATCRVFDRVRPTFCFHTAIAGLDPERRDPHEMVSTNIVGAYNVLAATLASGVRRLVVTGGSSEYGPQPRALREDDPAAPIGLYGASKAAATLLFQQAARDQDLPVIVLRLFSVYGPAEPEHRLVLTAIRAALSRDTLDLTPPGLRRDFVFIEDVVRACLLAAEADGRDGEIFNIGTGVETANEEGVIGVRFAEGSSRAGPQKRSDGSEQPVEIE